MDWLSGLFFNPGLAVGAAAVASPILIHLLSRRRFRRVKWAAMDFLLEAQRRNRRRIKIEQLILLALRCLAVFLIAMVVARPFVRAGTFASLVGASARTERIILLDDSFSMGYQPRSSETVGGETVFGRSCKAVDRIAHWLASETPDDALTLIATSHPREPILALPSLSEENLRKLSERLASLAPSQTTSHMGDAVAAVADLLRKAPIEANASLYVISDFQRQDWLASAESAADKRGSVLAPLASLKQRKQKVAVVLVDLGAESPANVAITDLAPVEPQAVAGVPARYMVSVTDFSPNPLTGVELSVSVASTALPPVTISNILPGQTVRQPIEVTFPSDGSDYVRVQLAGTTAATDGLSLDNTRLLGVGVIPAIRVLLVDGEPSNDPYRDEVFLLRTALRPAGRAASGIEVTVVDEEELETTEVGSPGTELEFAL